jgi:hypothetical protein
LTLPIRKGGLNYFRTFELFSMRSIKDLLELLYITIEALPEGAFKGMCDVRGNLFVYNMISRDELRALHTYFTLNIPEDAGNHLSGYWCNYSDYWWPKGDKAPRLKWLKEHMELLDTLDTIQ